MNLWQTIKRPPWRTLVPLGALLPATGLAYLLWQPGLDVCDGSHDRGHNAIWLGHGWLGDDNWFHINGKVPEISSFRDSARIRALADRLRQQHITDVFPHLCPARADGQLPAVDTQQAERFLDAFQSFRVFPWIGGPNGQSVQLADAHWRTAFVTNVLALIAAHPRFAGVQINIEPVQSGDTNYLQLLDEIRSALPKQYLLSVAAYPPPTIWHRYSDLHWDETYFRAVARRSDQLAVMTYDAAQRLPKTYQNLMAGWTREILAWSETKPVLIGVPTYKDADVGYHHSGVENITNALLGIHRALSSGPLPPNYQGVAIYCEWQTTATDWQYFQEHFLSKGRTQP